MSSKKQLIFEDIENLLDEFSDKISEKSNILMENMGNFCSALSYLTKNIDSMDDKKKLKALKITRSLLSKINQNTYDIIETLSTNDENVSYKDFINGYEDKLLFPTADYKPKL
jgi:hypothetical protein